MNKQITEGNITSEKLTGSLKMWDDLISLVNKDINQVIKNSDNCFIGLGSTLYELNGLSKEVSVSSLNTTELIGGEILFESFRDLKIFLKETKEYFSILENNIVKGEKKLDLLSVQLAKILDEISEFKKLVKTLRVLGISTKIENSRLNTEDTGFDALAEKVEDLSLVIGEKSVSIKDKINQLINLIFDVNKQIVQLNSEQKIQSEKILKDADESIVNLDQQYKLCNDKLKKVHSLSVNLSSNISEIVKSIQFNDITKQQLQHIIEAFNIQNDKLETFLNESESSENEGESENYSVIKDVCLLQKEQLKNSKNDLFKATTGLVSNLKGLGENVVRIFEETSKVFNIENTNSITITETNLKDIIENLGKNNELGERFFKLIKSVLGTIQELEKAILEIDEVGAEIELIALNARIKATHIGKDGAALDVLAEAIQRLSNDAKNRTAYITETLTVMTDSANVLNSDLGKDLEIGNHSVVVNKSQNCLKLIDNLKKINIESKKYIDKIQNKIEELESKLSSSINDIVSFSGQEKTLADILDSIELLISDLTKNGIRQTNMSSDLSHLRKHYSMDSERDVHRRLMKKSEKPKLVLEKKSGEDFGDNVELF